MPMTPSGLSSAIAAQLESMGDPLASSPTLADFCLKLATAIVEYIQASATVTGTAPSGGGPIADGKVE